jgi:hypothetical protein
MDATPEDAAAPLTADAARQDRWSEGKMRQMPGSTPYFNGPAWTKLTRPTIDRSTIRRTREQRVHRPMAVIGHR